MSTNLLRHAGTAVLALAMSTTGVVANDTGYGAAATPSAPASPLAEARKLIEKNRWSDAIAELQRANRPQDADWNNLMGYAHRKSKTPDLDAAQRYYDEALRLDPKHLGALEYSGELFLMKNDVAGAKQRLQQLEAVCGKRCPEYADLEGAIVKHEAKPTATR